MQVIKKRLLALPNREVAFELMKVFESLFNTQCLTSAALVTGAVTTINSGAAIHAVVNGQLVAKQAAAAFVLNGPTIQNTVAICQAWLFAMDAAGNLFTFPGVPAATIALVTLPTVPELAPSAPFMQLVVVGMATMTNASVGAFVPGATLTNVAGLGLVLSNIAGPFFPIQVL